MKGEFKRVETIPNDGKESYSGRKRVMNGNLFKYFGSYVSYSVGVWVIHMRNVLS